MNVQKNQLFVPQLHLGSTAKLNLKVRCHRLRRPKMVTINPLEFKHLVTPVCVSGSTPWVLRRAGRQPQLDENKKRERPQQPDSEPTRRYLDPHRVVTLGRFRQRTGSDEPVQRAHRTTQQPQPRQHNAASKRVFSPRYPPRMPTSFSS